MRVISGIYKSRKLLGYNIDGIRPTMDKVKESIFGMINPYINNSVFLDLFGGTGSMSIEAISNGCKKAYVVDNSNVAINIIKNNLKSLKISNCEVIKSDYNEAIKRFEREKIKFDIIFLDPPYNKISIDSILKKINLIVNNDGIVICEYEDEKLLDMYGNLYLYKNKVYGNTKISIYKWGE